MIYDICSVTMESQEVDNLPYLLTAYHDIEETEIVTDKKWRPFVNKLTSLKCLEAGWDSYNAIQIKPIIIEFVLSEISSLIRSNTPLPTKIVPIADGGIQLEWYIDDIELEIEFTQDKQIIVLYQDSSDEYEFNAIENIDRLKDIFVQMSH